MPSISRRRDRDKFISRFVHRLADFFPTRAVTFADSKPFAASAGVSTLTVVSIAATRQPVMAVVAFTARLRLFYKYRADAAALSLALVAARTAGLQCFEHLVGRKAARFLPIKKNSLSIKGSIGIKSFICQV
jgi:hypothetical protein